MLGRARARARDPQRGEPRLPPQQQHRRGGGARRVTSCCSTTTPRPQRAGSRARRACRRDAGSARSAAKLALSRTARCRRRAASSSTTAAAGTTAAAAIPTGRSTTTCARSTIALPPACSCARGSGTSSGASTSASRPAYYEDTDLCFAARDAAMVVYQPRGGVPRRGRDRRHRPDSGGKRFQELNRAKFAEKWAHRLRAEQLRPVPGAVRRASDRNRGPQCS